MLASVGGTRCLRTLLVLLHVGREIVDGSVCVRKLVFIHSMFK